MPTANNTPSANESAIGVGRGSIFAPVDDWLPVGAVGDAGSVDAEDDGAGDIEVS